MKCTVHDLEVMNLNPNQIELGVLSTSVCTYSHKPLGKNKVTICNHYAYSPLYVWPDVWSGDLQVLKMHGHAWHWMSFLRPSAIKQPRPKLLSESHLNQKYNLQFNIIYINILYFIYYINIQVIGASLLLNNFVSDFRPHQKRLQRWHCILNYEWKNMPERVGCWW